MLRKNLPFIVIIATFVVFGCSPAEPTKKIVKKEKKKVQKDSRVLKLAKEIISKKGNPDQHYNSRFSKDDNGIPILVWAVTHSDEKAVKLLLKNGADPNIKVMKKSTDPAIFEACPGVNLETTPDKFISRRTETKNICQLLIKAGVDLKYKNLIGVTVLSKAATSGRDDICELLIANGADVKQTDRIGNTPLHNAARYGYYKVVEVLLKNKADKKIKNKLQKTPLKLAEERLDENLHKGIRNSLPTAYPFADYDKTIELLKL